MQQFIGIDLGATAFKFGLVQEAKVIKNTVLDVYPSYSSSKLIELIRQGIEQLLTPQVAGIGIGVPGVVDPKAGIIYDIQNLPDWKEVNLGEQLRSVFKLPVYLNNDANCFAAGQLHYGQGRNYSNFVGLSIGTGLGMGIVIQGELYNGALCGAGEIGMLPYLDGIVEHYAASFFFTNRYKSSAKQLYTMAEQGDLEAIAAFKNFGEHLGQVLKIINYTYAPEAIILGGSITKASPYFNKQMLKTLNTFAYPKQIQHLKIHLAAGQDGAILGAASLCL